MTQCTDRLRASYDMSDYPPDFYRGHPDNTEAIWKWVARTYIPFHGSKLDDPKIQKRMSRTVSSIKRRRRLEIAEALGTHTPQEWNRLVDLCGNRCVKCKTHAKQLIGKTLLKDHVVPLVCAGEASDHISNLQPMCRNCNSEKGSRSIDYVPPKIRAAFIQ